MVYIFFLFCDKNFISGECQFFQTFFVVIFQVWCDVSGEVEVYWEEELGYEGGAGGVGGRNDEDLVRMINTRSDQTLRQ